MGCSDFLAREQQGRAELAPWFWLEDGKKGRTSVGNTRLGNSQLERL